MKTYVLLFFLLFSLELFSQQKPIGTIWFRPDNETKPVQNISDQKLTNDEELNNIFENRSVITYRQALPFAKKL